MAQLSCERITETSPFTVVGLDYCGPLYAKSAGGSRRTYTLLFSCAVTRAIHLELTSDMTTATTLLAFRRFVARRGVPSIVYFDNPQTFRSCAKWFESALTALRDYAPEIRIQ